MTNERDGATPPGIGPTPEPPPSRSGTTPGAVPPAMSVATSDSEERSMAALAHASIILNMFLPGLGIVAALAIWLTQRDHAPFAARQALQATVYQILYALSPVCLIIAAVIVAVPLVLIGAFTEPAIVIGGVVLLVLGIVTIGLILIIGLLYALVGAYEAYQGRPFRYWLVGSILERA